LGALVLVTVAGVVTPKQAFAGFASEAVLTIGALFSVAAGLRYTGVLDWVGQKLLGNVHSESTALRRLALSVIPVSAFVLNTPLVAMLMPVLIDWCRKHRVSPSRLLMPLSYFAILGGVCSLVGTSTTLVVNGWLEAEIHSGTWSPQFSQQLGQMGLFDIARVGLPCAMVGALSMLLFSRRRLPNRTELVEQLGVERREYLVEMLIQDRCPLVGKSVQDAGLRHLPGLFLIEIDRQGKLLAPVTPDDTLCAGDRLIFTGVVTTIADLEKIPGLVPAADRTYEFDPRRRLERQLTEVVLSRTSPVIGRTVRDANFRRLYNAAIVAVHRNGVRMTNKIGDIELEPGDTLIVQTRAGFVETYRHSRDFYLVSRVGGTSARRHDRALLAGILFLMLIVWLSGGRWFDPQGSWRGFSSSAVASIAIAGLMVATRCLPISQARAAVDLQVLITIGAALGLGTALQESGAAKAIAEGLVYGIQSVVSAPWSSYVTLALVYLLTMVFTELITNVSVAATMLPLAVQAAQTAGCSPRPFVMAIALAASLSFVTPIGYQTNLMVMGPGGYQPRDYLRLGLPLAIVVMITALIGIPIAYPLEVLP
ncbi:MAG: SLC13 family permease, partial [Pirellulales bacterium]